MNSYRAWRGLLAVLLLSLSSLFGAEELLASQDVNRIMEQIFKQHVDKNHMTDEIIRNSFHIYIDQFDKERVYLLQSEVDPYLKMSDADVKKVLEQYRNHDLSTYKQLNDQIVKSIDRARQNRAEIQKTKVTSLAVPIQEAGFAADLNQLKKRQQDHFSKFLEAERVRYGDAYLHTNYDKLVAFYNKKQNQFESQYMPVTVKGVKLTAQQQDHQFLIHVLKALSSSLDSHTTVLDTDEAYDMRVRLKKGYEGVGITVSERPDGFFITKLVEGAPAARSGQIKSGDQLMQVDGESTEQMELSEIEDKLHGDAGTTLVLLVSRSGGEPFRVTLQRETISINEGRAEITYESFGNGIIGTIKLDSFYQGANGVSSVNDVKKAIEDLDKKGNLRGLILDLRQNSGGFLSQAIKVAGLFITNGVVVISKYHNGEEYYYRDMDSSVAYDGPLVILTSRATASAAEIVAQALQDYGVGIVVGDEQTYGKGTIQSQTVTQEDGSGSYFKVTVGKYYTVSGKTPQLQGVKADIVVPGKYSQFAFGEEYLDYAVNSAPKDTIAAAYHDPLSDIKPVLKTWYMRYYMPTLQEPRTKWNSVMPQLKENSEYRIGRNKNYQVFLKQLKGEKITTDEEEPEADEYGRIKKDNVGQEDVQLQEAINVVKDMIYLQPKAEHSIP